MCTRKASVTGLGFSAVVFIAGVLLLFAPTDARAITFGEWAGMQRWPNDVAPAEVRAWTASIDSLAGISDYDWMTTPTTSLDFAGTQVTSIESGAFTGLGSLTYLRLMSTQVANIESGAFTGLDSLTDLDLSSNEITNIASGAFNGLDNLTDLDLHWNNITVIQSGAFTGLNSLPHLSLELNKITNIESGAFTGLGNLTSLGLFWNQITSIESGDFAGLGNLTWLKLAINQIKSIEPNSFAGLGNLTYLGLDQNQIKTIEPGTFAGLGSLSILYLDDNQITSVASGDFAGLGNLTRLDLSGNQLSNIESGTLAGLGKLQSLWLGYNTSLTDLNLESANLFSLSTFDLTGSVNVARVSLRNATLTQTALAALISGGGGSNYSGIGGLPGITDLDLSGIDFAAITDISPLYLMDSLTDLWLADALNLNADALDVLLDNLAVMEDPNIEGVLYLTQADYNAFNTAGSGKLARWDAELGHHVQIVPEPGALVTLAGALVALGIFRFRRSGFPA